MKIKNVTDNFEIQELIEFPTNKQAIIHFDALHPKKHLLYYNEGSIDILTFDSGLLSTWRVPNLHSARQLKMNHDFLLLGVLISAKVLEIRVLYNPQPIKVIERDDNVSDFILGFEWVFKEELMVLCSNGIYLYKFTQNECSEPKKIKIRMNWYLYSPSINLLIVSTGTPNLFMYKLGIGRVCETYPNLSLMSRPKSKQLVIPEPVTRLHIHLFTLYGHHYIGHLSNAADETNLSLYRLSSKMLYRKELELKLPSGIYSFNVFDNLLLCHNLTKKISMIFDIKAVKSTEFLLSTNELFQFIGDSEPAINESIRDSHPTSVFGPRNYIFSIKAGRVYTVELKLNPIMDNMLSRNWTCQEITRFVLDRTFGIGSGVRFKALRVLLQKCAPLDEVTLVYNLLSINHDKISYGSLI